MQIYRKPDFAQTRWFSPENPMGRKGEGGRSNRGAKGRAFVPVPAGATVTLVDHGASGLITRIWATINDRSPEMLRSLRIDMTWDHAARPAVSAPFGDFFGIGLGQRLPFENALFSDPEGRSFNSLVPMPFRRHALITVTNESDRDLPYLFYDVDAVVGLDHPNDVLYFHAHWRRESPNTLGEEYRILPRIGGEGRFLGANIGVITNPVYGDSWWGEGEVKVRLDGDIDPTLCGTGTEDYIGTAWGQGKFLHLYQGCSIADSEKGYYAFYRYHVKDPVYFSHECEVGIQTMGGAPKDKLLAYGEAGAKFIAVTADAGPGQPFRHLLEGNPRPDLASVQPETAWCNFWRQDDWSSTAYFYLNRPETALPPLAKVTDRLI